jgi:hypothetical protein
MGKGTLLEDKARAEREAATKLRWRGAIPSCPIVPVNETRYYIRRMIYNENQERKTIKLILYADCTQLFTNGRRQICTPFMRNCVW